MHSDSLPQEADLIPGRLRRPVETPARRICPFLFALMTMFLAPDAFGARPPMPPFPPAPDFSKRYDYVAWYDAAVGKPEGADAYKAFAAFLSGMVGGAGLGVPPFAGMLTGDGWNDGPIPWDPAAHAPWESSNKVGKAAVNKFAAASRLARYSAPSGQQTGVESGQNLLSKAKRPYLDEMVKTAKATMESAWRTDKDKALPEALIAAAQTCLRAARQVEQGISVPEQVAAFQMRQVAYDNLRWGFAHDVFSQDNADEVAKMLTKADRDPIDLRRAIRGDAAAAMDSLQYVFGPQRGSGGTPPLNAQRFSEVTGYHMGASRMGLGARITSDVSGTAKTILDMYKTIDRLATPPVVSSKVSQIQDAVNQAQRFNQITQGLVSGDWPGIYDYALRTESDRRATRELAEVFAYRGKKKQWPKELKDLGSKKAHKPAIDPYSGKPFVYRRTVNGMTMYSVGRNARDDGGNHADWQVAGGNDFVYWPIPNSDKLVASVKLKAAPVDDTTAILDIGEKRIGKMVTVVADVTRVDAKPSRKFIRVYTITLAQGQATIPLVYHEDVAKHLSDKQQIRVGVKVRIVAEVVKGDKGVQLMLRDANQLVVEESEKKAP